MTDMAERIARLPEKPIPPIGESDAGLWNGYLIHYGHYLSARNELLAEALSKARAYIDRVNRDEGWFDATGDGERIHDDADAVLTACRGTP